MDEIIWTDYADGTHVTCYKGIYVEFVVHQISNKSDWLIKGRLSNNHSFINHDIFSIRIVSSEFLSIPQTFQTPLDLFKSHVERLIKNQIKVDF